MAGAAFAGLDVLGSLWNMAQNDKADKAARTSFTQNTSAQLAADNPGKNIMVICTAHDASGLKGSKHSTQVCNSTTYDCYLCDSGVFVRKGDG